MALYLEDHLYSKYKRLYNESPQSFKSVFGRLYRFLPPSLRYGQVYSQCISLLKKSQFWSKEEIIEYQWIRTQELLRYAFKNVPYYTKTFNEYGISIKNIQNFTDFRSIPYLTKEIIREKFNDLVSKTVKKSDIISVSTGGTTGIPLQLYYEKGVTRSLENAFTNHGWERVGYNCKDKVVVLRGDVINRPNMDVPFFFDPIKNRLVLSSYHLIEKNMQKYIDIIRIFKPDYLHVYPSVLTPLALYLQNNRNYSFPKIKGIFASSETIYKWQNNLFTDVFDCKVFPWYGLNELVALGGGCEFSLDYHLFPEYSYIELLPDENFLNDPLNNIVQIVGTGFINNAMPLIRYKTMDYGIHKYGQCQCGRNYPLIEKILGRKQGFFVDKTGSLISFIYADVPLWNVKHKISAYQYVQEQPGEVILKIEAKNRLSHVEKIYIMRKFQNIYKRFKIEVQTVNSIPKTPNGKFLYLKQNLKTKETQLYENSNIS